MVGKLTKSALLLSVFMIVSKIIGMLREILLAQFYGASNISDAYIVATSAYGMIFSSLSIASVSSYVQYASSNTINENRTITKLVSYVCITVLLISVLICIYPSIFVVLFSVGVDEYTENIITQMLYIIMPPCFLLSARYIFNAFLQSKNYFLQSAKNNILTGIIVMIAIVLSNGNYIILLFGEVIAIIFCFALTFVKVRKLNYKYDFTYFFDIKELKPIFLLMTPLFLGQFIQQFNVIIDKNFASLVGEGIISSINYANKINILFSTFFVVSITTVLFPTLSKLSNNKNKFSEISTKSAKIIFMTALPVGIGIFLLAEPLISVLYLRGAFTQEDLVVTTQVLKIYSLGIPALSLNDLLNKQFYAMGNTKTPVILSVFTLTINLLLNFLLVNRFGHIGLSFSTTVSVITLCVLLNVVFSKTYHLNILAKNKKCYILIAFACTAMGMGVYLALRLLIGTNNFAILVICGTIAILIYIFILFLFKDEDILKLKSFLFIRR